MWFNVNMTTSPLAHADATPAVHAATVGLTKEQLDGLVWHASIGGSTRFTFLPDGTKLVWFPGHRHIAPLVIVGRS